MGKKDEVAGSDVPPRGKDVPEVLDVWRKGTGGSTHGSDSARPPRYEGSHRGEEGRHRR